MDIPSRAALLASVSRDDVDDAMAAGGWRLINVIAAAPGRPSQLIFARAAGAAYVFVVDDARLGLTYLVTQGEAAPERLEELRETLPCHAPGAHEALLARLDDARLGDAHPGDGPRDESGAVDELVLGLALLALEPPSDRGDAWLRIAMAHDDARVRATALTVSTYAPRPGLLPSLLAMESGDAEPALREAAAKVLASLHGGAA